MRILHGLPDMNKNCPEQLRSRLNHPQENVQEVYGRGGEGMWQRIYFLSCDLFILKLIYLGCEFLIEYTIYLRVNNYCQVMFWTSVHKQTCTVKTWKEQGWSWPRARREKRRRVGSGNWTGTVTCSPETFWRWEPTLQVCVLY